jgi:nuclear pore complex protein Nup98-Nup96
MGDTVTENRIPDLRFSERFQLTWRQAFGLHLFWGIDSKQGIENAVASYEAALRDGKETKRPIPWYVEQGISTGWKDPHPEERQDVLWGLVKLHTANYPDNVQLSEVVAPENVTGNPINARLSFQLLHLIKSHQGSEHTSPLEDDITRAYASSLEPAAAEDHEGLKTAVWALTHLSDRNERVQSIKRLLELNATLLDPSGNPLALHAPPGSEIQYLVPRDWECAAKALYARAVEHDPVSEAHWLINAGQLVEAHHVVCTVIGPDAVIEEDHDQLREILKSLASDPHRKNQIPERVFERGGALYHSYLELLDLEALHAQHRTTKKNDIHAHVQSIAKVLAGLHKEGAIEKMEIKQRAALQFMGNHLVEVCGRLRC